MPRGLVLVNSSALEVAVDDALRWHHQGHQDQQHRAPASVPAAPITLETIARSTSRRLNKRFQDVDGANGWNRGLLLHQFDHRENLTLRLTRQEGQTRLAIEHWRNATAGATSGGPPQPLPPRCESWCPAHSEGWQRKCNFFACSGCVECNGITSPPGQRIRPERLSQLPWLGGAHDPFDFFSATYVSARMSRDPSGSMPLFSYTLAGYVLRPSQAKVRCSFAHDTSTNRRSSCAAIGSECQPGCTPMDKQPQWRPGVYQWCRVVPTSPFVTCDYEPRCWGCPWRPEDFDRMLAQWQAVRRNATALRPSENCCRENEPCRVCSDAKFYNEVVIDRKAFNAGLPRSIEAFFYIPGTRCDDYGTKFCMDGDERATPLPAWCPRHLTYCETYARHAHRAFLELFFRGHERSGDMPPLLRLDPHNFSHPFTIDGDGADEETPYK